MPTAGEQIDKFGRTYVFIVPETPVGTPGGVGTVGTYRLMVAEENLPEGGLPETSATAAVAIQRGQLVYLDSSGELDLASASSISTAAVVGMSVSAVAAGEDCQFVRNVAEEFTFASSLVDGSPSALTAGQTYYLSTTPGNWTTTPDTSTSGAVVLACGIALAETEMSIEIQTATVI